MPLLFLNEKSCGTACDAACAERAMTGLAEAVLAVVRADRSGTVLVSREPITGLQIAHGHPIGKWHGAPRNKDLWTRLLQMQSKWPHRTVFPEGENHFDVEYRYRGETVDGLGAAHLMDGLGVSLLVDACWGEHQLALEREQLVEGDEGESDGSETGEVSVRHMAALNHFEAHRTWIEDGAEAVRRGGLNAVRRGDELWAGRAVFFPSLQFLPRVEDDLRQLPEVWVRPVRERLVELEAAVAGWDPVTHPIAPQWRSDVRTEFESRRRLCWFRDGDKDELFDWHSEFLPTPGRMHFRLLHEEHTVRIAYVGRKLGNR